MGLVRILVAYFVMVLSLLTATAQNSQHSPAVTSKSGDSYQLQNGSIGAKWSISEGKLGGLTMLDRIHQTELRIPEPFAISIQNGPVYDASALRVSSAPTTQELVPHPDAPRLADQSHGIEIDIPMQSEDGALRLIWSVIVLDNTSYLRQSVTIQAGEKDLPIHQIRLVNVELSGAHRSGIVDGSPIVTDDMFLGLEHPMSQSTVHNGHASAWIERSLPLRAGQKTTYSAVFGVAQKGQLRRTFLAYIESERSHPYRTFLHYNSWYDIGYFTPYTEAEALDRINAFGSELAKKRNVKLSSYLFDDGWDNHKSLWQFNEGFPNGFTPLKEAAEKYGAEPGVWMSPWGGYGKPKQERIEYGRSMNYEIVSGGYALSGSKYYEAFRQTTLDMVQKYGVNQFKFDGTGNVDSVIKGSNFDSDFSAAIHLIGELRTAKSGLFVNLTTGTWPSPFWLLYADSIWRGGEDDSTTGVGSYRERWITYRDADTYQHVVQGGPLYPLNSLMLHGIIYARMHKQLREDPGNDFRNEVRSYFGTGTQLQELYITPELLSRANWDDLAEAANWSHANEAVLKDTHWIGGDPAWLEVYGWASWTPSKGILVLRNPNDKLQTIQIRLQDAFELPDGAAQKYLAKSPWKNDTLQAKIELSAQQLHTFHLAPFEVLTLDIIPQ